MNEKGSEKSNVTVENGAKMIQKIAERKEA